MTLFPLELMQKWVGPLTSLDLIRACSTCGWPLHSWLISLPFLHPPLPHVSTWPFQAWLPFWCQPQDWEFASWQPPSPSVAPAIPPKLSPAPLRGQRGSPGQVVKHHEPTPPAGLQPLLLLAFLLLYYFIWLCLECGLYVLLSMACFSHHVSVCVIMFSSHLPGHWMNAQIRIM